MRVLIQRVSHAEVRVEDEIAGSIGPGLLVLMGVTGSDTASLAAFMAEKVANLRILDDENGVMNRSTLDVSENPEVNTSILVVSQFTLYADCRKGRRPSYIRAAAPDHAMQIVDQFVDRLRKLGPAVETGVFGAEMAVELVNDGPVTIMLDSDELRPAM